MMRVVSMVPSLTETLIEAGVEVVGRTRYCVHPATKVKNVAVVGGTKDISWKKVKALQADLLLLDQEENPKSMSEESPIPVLAIHVRGIRDMPAALEKIADTLGSPALKNQAGRWKKISSSPPRNLPVSDLPGVVEWINKPNHDQDIKKIIYVIWHNPWMAASRDTFIGSVLAQIGFSTRLVSFETLYPKFALEGFNPRETLLLFSSEPFPFLKKKKLIKTLPFASAIVDGESFSWFGIRALRFLEKSVKN